MEKAFLNRLKDQWRISNKGTITLFSRYMLNYRFKGSFLHTVLKFLVYVMILLRDLKIKGYVVSPVAEALSNSNANLGVPLLQTSDGWRCFSFTRARLWDRLGGEGLPCLSNEMNYSGIILWTCRYNYFRDKFCRCSGCQSFKMVNLILKTVKAKWVTLSDYLPKWLCKCKFYIAK